MKPTTKTKAQQALEKALDSIELRGITKEADDKVIRRDIRRAVKEAVREAEVRHLHCGLVRQTNALVNLAEAIERMEATVAKISPKPRRRAGGKK